MNKATLLFLTVLIPLALSGQGRKKVLIIGIDGCRPDALQAAHTPNIDNLISQGLFSPDALNDGITISGPGWSSMLCGVWPDKHLVTGNDFTINNYEAYPHIYKYIEAHDPALHTVSICHWAPINDFIVQDHADFKVNTSTDLEVASLAAAYLAVNDPDIVFLHFDDVDHAGHSSGFSPDNSTYVEAIAGVDVYVGTVMQSLMERANYQEEDWLVLVSTDHGGQGFSHGGNSIQEQRIMFIASGPSVPQSLILRDSIIITDVPANCLGDSIELHFDGTGDQVYIPPNPNLNFGPGQDFTIECRVRTPQAGDVAIVGNKDWNSGNNQGFVFSFKYPSGPEWKVNIGDGSSRADINTGSAIADNEWHTLSVSFDRDGLMVMYEDGEVADSTDISFIGDIDTNEGLFFGADINGAFAYQGAISELRVWNSVLDGQTIKDWYCSALDDTHAQINNLAGYWKLNEGQGQTEVADLSGNNNPGTLNGPEWQFPQPFVEYDYSATPRITDVGVTALAHLCIPMAAEWGLDGKSLIPECVMTNTESLGLVANAFDFTLSPNPGKDKVGVKVNDRRGSGVPLMLALYYLDGRKIYESPIHGNEAFLDTSSLSRGIYFVALQGYKYTVVKKLVVVGRD